MTDAEAGGRLRAAREYVGLDVRAAAAASGVTEGDLATIEAGDAVADELTLQRLGRAYGVRSSYFTEPEDELHAEAVVVLGRLAGELTGHDRDEALRFAGYLRHTIED
ncbi:MAG: helix-turn-helix domain-containing protein [Solirubrobacteraceae bacterium]